MSTACELIDLAEECFRQAECQESPSAIEALRKTGLHYLEEAHATWRQGKDRDCYSSGNADGAYC